MSRLPHPSGLDVQRYPGLDVMAQAPHWDAATSAVVSRRLGTAPAIRFFTAQEVATASALCDRLLAQDEEPRVPVVNLIDLRLAQRQTDGWHHVDMPHDDEAWRASLAALDEDARRRHSRLFHELDLDSQNAMLRDILGRGTDSWHDLRADRVWSLWTRYACAAFYSHPWAWEEIGFTGPAYPRGYKHLGIDAREPFEVTDARPDLDPTRRATQTKEDA